MVRPLLLLTVLGVLAVSGCPAPVRPGNQPLRVAPAPALSRIYTYSGRGYRPKFKEDLNAKIDWIEVGSHGATARGHSRSGGGGVIQWSRPARIGFGSGAVLSFESVT